MTARRRVHAILELNSPGDRVGNWLNIALATLILTNVVTVTLETIPEWNSAYAGFFDAVEIISVSVFGAEYLLRLWVSAESHAGVSVWRARLRYVVTPIALADLLAIAPVFLSLLFPVDPSMLRALRLLRVLKLLRHLAVMDVLVTVLRNEAATLISAFALLSVMILLTATGIYLLEQQAQPQAFGSVPHALWWAAVTLTTVGYGDVVPITVGGRILGTFMTVLGVGMAALPAGIIAAGFTNEMKRRRDRFRVLVRRALKDGNLDATERPRLRERQAELGIGRGDGMRIIDQMLRQHGGRSGYCPHCGLPLNPQ